MRHRAGAEEGARVVCYPAQKRREGEAESPGASIFLSLDSAALSLRIEPKRARAAEQKAAELCPPKRRQATAHAGRPS
jgi:hypothetical protein